MIKGEGIRSEVEVRRMLKFVRGMRKPFYMPRRGKMILHKTCWETCLEWVLGEVEVSFPKKGEVKKVKKHG